MATLTSMLDLVVDSTSDRWKTQDVTDNLNKIDAAPGIFICTSTTRPNTWGAAQAGRKIIETDTVLEWVWTGSAFKRLRGKGLLAYAEKVTQTVVTSGARMIVLAVTSVVVPDGQRPLSVECTIPYPWSTGSGDGASLTLNQSSTVNTGPFLATMFPMKVGRAQNGRGFMYSGKIPAGLAAGTYAFSIQIDNTAGTSSVTIDGGSVAVNGISGPTDSFRNSLAVIEH